MNKMVDQDLINKFVEGKASKAEVKLILEWIYTKEFENQISNSVSEELKHLSRVNEWNEKDQLERLKKKLTDIPSFTIVRKEKKSNIRLLKYAASLLLPLIIGFLLWQFSNKIEMSNSFSELTYIEKTTSLGQKSTIFLEDGSRIILNSGSKIVFPKNFSDTLRSLELEGEAFFYVHSDSLRPFIVKTGSLNTTALGTSFNINYYDKENPVVSLVTGKVFVDNNGSQKLLNPNEQVLIQNQEFIVSRFNPDEVISWKDGILMFKDSKFEDVVEKLENWYGVEVEVNDKPESPKHYSGRYNNENLENVLKGIGFINDFNFEIEGKKVTITFNKK